MLSKSSFTTRWSGTFFNGAMLISSTSLLTQENLTRNPALAAVSGMNVWWAVIVGEYIDHGPSGFGYEHPTHGRA